MSRLRSCHFTLILYLDNPNHVECLNFLTKNGYKYAAICHDQDVDENGNPLKAHYHVVVSFTRQKDLSSFSREISLEANLIEICRNVEASLRYLTHPDNPEKYQYDPDLIFGSNRERAILLSSLYKPTENERVLLILDLLSDMVLPITTKDAIVALCKAGLYSDARRMGMFLVKIIDELNSHFI